MSNVRPLRVSNAFHIAAFAPDGELQGTGVWLLSKLSPRWLAVCDNLLTHGEVFRTSLSGALSHIEIKLTSSNGAGLGMFFVRGSLAISTAYFRGENPQAEEQVLEMLLDSLRSSAIVQSAATSATPFEALRSLNERPLNVVIAWGSSEICEADHQLVRELSNHFAGAYLCNEQAA